MRSRRAPGTVRKPLHDFGVVSEGAGRAGQQGSNVVNRRDQVGAVPERMIRHLQLFACDVDDRVADSAFAKDYQQAHLHRQLRNCIPHLPKYVRISPGNSRI